MENNDLEEVMGVIETSEGGHCEEIVFDDGASSVCVDEDLGAYESDEGLPLSNIVSSGDLIRIKSQIATVLNSGAPANLKEIREVIEPIVATFNFPPMKKVAINRTVCGFSSLPENDADVFEYLNSSGEKYAVVVTISYVRIYGKHPYFNWVKSFFTG